MSAATGTSRRAWGWHRLDHEWAARIVAQAGIRPGELVLDIGAGEGALTAPLIRAGARVVAVELHPESAFRLLTTIAAALLSAPSAISGLDDEERGRLARLLAEAPESQPRPRERAVARSV